MKSEADLLDLGVDHKLIEKSGSWFAYKSERLGQGRENARQFLRDNRDLRAEIETRLRKELGLPNAEPVAAPAEAAKPAAVVQMPEKKKA